MRLPAYRSLRLEAALLGLALALGCAHAPGPTAVAEAYARALEEGRLSEAYLLTEGPPEAQQAFLERYAEPQARKARAAQVRAGLSALQAQGPSLLMTHSSSNWRVVEAAPGEEARAVLERFLGAVEQGEWATAWSLLSGPLRSRYTPERLQRDYESEPLAPERVRRARVALQGAQEGALRLEQGEALLPLGGGAAVRLVLEGGEYRVAAME